MTDFLPPLIEANSVNRLKLKRLDGRSCSDGRIPEILFAEWGSCMVFLGATNVSAEVSTEIMEPSLTDSCGNHLQVTVELSPEFSLDLNQSQNSNEAVECQKYLEKCLSNNNCLNLEAFIFIAGSKMCILKLAVIIYANDGNLFECASIAAITALLHFKMPDSVIVESLSNSKPLFLPLTDIPLVINLAVMKNFILVDPTKMEERDSDSTLIIATNASREIYFIQCKGALLSIENIVAKCKSVMIQRVEEITQLIKRAIARDIKRREMESPELCTFGNTTDDVCSGRRFKLIMELLPKSFPASIEKDKAIEIEIVQKSEIAAKDYSKNSGMVSKWGIEEEIGSSSEDEDAVKIESERTISKQRLKCYKKDKLLGRNLTDIHSQRVHSSCRVTLRI